MSRVVRAAFVILIGVLIGSVGLNLFLYQAGRGFYLQLNSTRLDPHGTGAFSDDASSAVQKTDRPTIVFFGDSRAAAWPAPGEITDVNFVNRGIGAQTSAQVIGRFAQHVAPLRPDTIVLQVGINDLKTIPLFPEQQETVVQNCKANIQALVKLALDAGAREVILTTIFPLGPIPLERRPFWSDEVAVAIEEVNAFIGSLAGGRVTVFDTTPILADADGIVRPQYRRDFLHLNPAGYAALNEELVQALRQ